MKRSETSLLLTLGTIACCCFTVIVLSAGCDFGTYGERVESTGGTLPTTTVSQESGSTSKDAGSDKKDSGSDSKAAGSDSKDAGSGSKDAGSDTKDALAGSDTKDDAAE